MVLRVKCFGMDSDDMKAQIDFRLTKFMLRVAEFDVGFACDSTCL
jgi:hypothetical protein